MTQNAVVTPAPARSWSTNGASPGGCDLGVGIGVASQTSREKRVSSREIKQSIGVEWIVFAFRRVGW